MGTFNQNTQMNLANQTNETKRLKFAVLGNPIEHSLSHLIHREFASQTGIDLEYDRIQVNVDFFPQAIESLIKQGYHGFNITLPFKEEAHDFCQKRGRLTPLASRACAVNTVDIKADGVSGHNTDGLGLVRDLVKRLNTSLYGKKILVLGAGGAVRGIVPALLDAGADVRLSNRTHARAEAICELFDVRAIPLAVLQSPEKAKRETFDLVINATSSELNLSSLGLADEVFAHTELAYDLMYRKDRLTTVFLQHAKDCHVATTSDGLGMLIEQAAQAFDIWHDVFPETAPVLEKIESHLLREHLQRMGGSSEQDFQNGTTLQ
jgi:shikimate dehydrogenase